MILGWSLVRTEELKRLEKCGIRMQTLMNVHRWFAGWRDLDIIWDYILSETYFGDIGSCRQKYAEARKTDEYGNAND